MKTFDEAIKAVGKGPIGANLDGQMGESIQNEDFVRIIQALAVEYMLKVAQIRDNEQLIALTCSTLQAVFEFGRTVGIEMEKRDVTLS